jgi:hypothetical protein
MNAHMPVGMLRFPKKPHALAGMLVWQTKKSTMTFTGMLRDRRNSIHRAIHLLAAVWLLAACHLQPRLEVEPLPAYDSAFDRESGWVGGDGAYSTPLGPERILWLFGDTFVGRVEGGRRTGARLIANSLAVQQGRDPASAALEFFYGPGEGGSPAPIFPAEGEWGERGWFWPYHAVRTPAGLFVFLLQVERTDPASAFGFRVTGIWLARVADPDAPPAEWRPDLRRVPWSDGHRLFGSCVLTEGGECYIYGTVDDPAAGSARKHAIVARVAAERLPNFEEWRFFTGDAWVPEAERARWICPDVAPEFSVSYQPGIGRYVMVHSAAGLAPEMVVRYADAPHGPWGEPVRFFRCPEAGWDERIFCYAAKGHPEIAPAASELIVSYVANATDLTLVEADARLYRPRFLRLKFSGGSLFFGVP